MIAKCLRSAYSSTNPDRSDAPLPWLYLPAEMLRKCYGIESRMMNKASMLHPRRAAAEELGIQNVAVAVSYL
jgi:hypothetical protein